MITAEDIDAFKDIQDQFREWVETPNIMQMVEDFRFTAGQDKNPFVSKTLVVEEYLEWSAEAFNLVVHKRYSKEDELKELADLVYVIFGYANSLGWDLNEAVKRIHENNMGRMYQPDGTIEYRKDGKVMKNESYPKVNLEDLV